MAPRPAIASISQPVGASRNGCSSSAAGGGGRRRTVSSGGSSIMAAAPWRLPPRGRHSRGPGSCTRRCSCSWRPSISMRDRLVERHRYPQCLRLAHQGAVERRDLGAPAGLQMLQHRGLAVLVPAMRLDLGAQLGLRQVQTLGAGHRQRLVQQPVLVPVGRRQPRQLAHAQAGDGADRVDRDVDDELLPDRRHDVGAEPRSG